MSVSMTDKVFIVVGLIDVIGIFVSTGVALYFAYRKMDLMLSHLENCRTITIHIFLLNAGPRGRLYVLGKVMGLMTMPGVFLRDGGAAAEDLKNFPTDLRRQLVALQWTGWILLLVSIGMGVIAQFELI